MRQIRGGCCTSPASWREGRDYKMARSPLPNSHLSHELELSLSISLGERRPPPIPSENSQLGPSGSLADLFPLQPVGSADGITLSPFPPSTSWPAVTGLLTNLRVEALRWIPISLPTSELHPNSCKRGTSGPNLAPKRELEEVQASHEVARIELHVSRDGSCRTQHSRFI